MTEVLETIAYTVVETSLRKGEIEFSEELRRNICLDEYHTPEGLVILRCGNSFYDGIITEGIFKGETAYRFEKTK